MTASFSQPRRGGLLSRLNLGLKVKSLGRRGFIQWAAKWLRGFGQGKTETALRAQQEYWLRTMPAMLHSIDSQGRLVAVSDLWLAKLGYTRDEVLGRPSSDFLTSESRDYAVKSVLPEFFTRGRCENVEYQMVCKNGRIVDVLLSAVLVEGETGQGRASLAVITDVTDRKAIERQLADNEMRYRRLVEDQSELISLATPDGELRFVNPAYARLYGKQPSEMIGKSLFDFVPTDARLAVREHLENVCGRNDTVEAENQVVPLDGQARWIAWTNRALRDSSGTVTAIHSVGRDIEQRIAIERRLKESEARYRLLAENSTDMILLVTRDGKRLYASPACRTILGWTPEEMLLISTKDAIHPDDAGFLEQRRAYNDDEVTSFQYRMRRKDGGYVWVESISRAVQTSPDEPPHRLVVVRDIAERVAAEQQLKDSEARYRLLAENSTDMVLQLGLDLSRQYVSPASREIFGYEPDELIGAKSGEMAHPEDAARVAHALQSLISGEVDRQTVVARRRHREGHWIWIEAQYRALKDPATRTLTGIVGAIRDISVRKAIEEQLAHAYQRLEILAKEDGLTGLANRRAFDEALATEFRRAQREGKSVALVMIDVDHFKAFNDQYGHPAGDRCLKLIGEVIRNAVYRAGDLAARYGGEEFAVLLPETAEIGAAIIAERIRKGVSMLRITHASIANGIVTASAGVAAFEGAATESPPESLLQTADRALYRAKRTGRNRTVCSSAPLPEPVELRAKGRSH